MGRNVKQQSLLRCLTHKRLRGYLVYTDGWLWFGHVHIVLRTPNSWVKINQNMAYTDVDVVPLGWDLNMEGEVHPFIIDVPIEQKRYGIGAYSCVQQIKSILGITEWWICTPKQLKRYMKWRKDYTQTYTPSGSVLKLVVVKKCENLVTKVHQQLKRLLIQLRLLRNHHWLGECHDGKKEKEVS